MFLNESNLLMSWCYTELTDEFGIEVALELSLVLICLRQSTKFKAKFFRFIR